MGKNRIGLVGYGNVGKGVEAALAQFPDMEGVAVFTRRKPEDIKSRLKAVPIDGILDYKNKIDVLILCGGSATDLPEQGPEMARHFCTIDSYDNHAKIPDYFAAMDEAARKSGNVSIISVGWDPGMFSLSRVLYESVIPEGKNYTFWGKGVSQGHSDAIRRVRGVKKGIQYTIPVEAAIEKVREGNHPEFAPKDQHTRLCYVVLEAGADAQTVKQAIVTMPNYFQPYNTTVKFISEEEFDRDHTKMPHGGFVIRTGKSENGSKHRIEFSLASESNPELTASILVAYARAAVKFKKQGKRGAFSVLDIPFAALSAKTGEELRREML